MPNTWKPAVDSPPAFADSERVVTRAQFLARCPLATSSVPHLPDRSVQSKVADRNARTTAPKSSVDSITPPPGLGPQTELETQASVTASVRAPRAPTKSNLSPTEAWTPYQVLLSGLPSPMMSEQMVLAMCEQAQLETGIDSIRIKKGDKVLINFKSSDLVPRCIGHFQGRAWGGSIVMAVQVNAAKSKTSKSANVHKVPQAPSPVSLNVDAPVYEPAYVQIPKTFFGKSNMQLSPDAAVFVPSTTKASKNHSRSTSVESTEAGEALSGNNSDS